ncbi:MAG TPA: FAD-dependent oxidoreductase, partial [Deinococcales bacterium]|nr:FAD-dependent oxidoreductase [Deinococcales bacterium]
MSHRIVILGGGTGGTLAANLLARRLSPEKASVTLVSDSTRHLYQPGWLYVPFSWQSAPALARPERNLLSKRVAFENATVEGLDLAARAVRLSGGRTLPYDTLVIASGSRPTPEDVPGLQEGGHHFYTEAAALKLKAALEAFQGGKIVVGVGGLPHKCPVAPLEFTFLLDDWLRRRGLRERTEITYTYPINRPFTIQSVSKVVEPLLEQKGIRVETFFNLESVDVKAKMAVSLEGTE